ncbi:MAG: DUF2652 domain-containing protein [Anaerolineales bacterium]|nr:DUF2652 domain-containing protein [Anaerolineales bacterium]
MIQRGFLVIADITGYTAFLSGSELEHAQDSLRSLIELLIKQTTPPLQISRLEGDAVISYAPEGSFLQGQTLLESLEGTYIAFRLAQQRMQLNTTCTCLACKNIPNLDLKFFVHYGEYMEQKLGPYTELIGNDVNLVHRLLKNQVTEKTRIKAYALFTQAAIDALSIPELENSLTSYSEADEYMGEVKLYVQNLQEVWERQRDQEETLVPLDEALFTIEEDFPLNPALLWDYLTKPEYRAILNQSDYMGLENTIEGRTTTGSVYICAHGDASVQQAIVDWRPFQYYTYESEGVVPGTCNLVTIYLQPFEGGTRILGACGKSIGPESVSEQNDDFILQNVPAAAQDGCRKLYERVRVDLELGIIVQPHAIAVSSEEVEAAVELSLNQ